MAAAARIPLDSRSRTTRTNWRCADSGAVPASVASTKTLSPTANWQELVIGAGFLTLAAVMAWILARPAEPQR